MTGRRVQTDAAQGVSRLRDSRGWWWCVLGGAIGLRGVIAWMTGRPPFLTTRISGLPPMMPSTALALVLLGVAAVARHWRRGGPISRAVALLAATAVLVVGVGTLLEYLFSLDLRLLAYINALFPNLQTVAPAASSPLTALALTLLASAFLLLDVRPQASLRPSEVLALAAALTAFTGLTGIVLGAEPLYRSARSPIIGLSVATSVSVLLIAIGLLRGLARGGAMRVATSPGPGGILFRRLAPPVVALPIVIGLAVTRIAETQGITGSSVPVAILAAAMTALNLGLLLASALPLNRAHDALEDSHRRTTQLVEQAPEGIFIASVDGAYIDVNEAGCRLLGYTRDEILARTIADVVLPADVPRLWEARDDLLRGNVHMREWTLVRKDGSQVATEIYTRILPDGRWQAFVRDISERKRLAEQLRLSEAKSTGILAISADAIISTDDEQRITQFNEGAEKIFGYSKSEAIGAPLDMLIPGRFRAAHRSHVEGFAASPAVARRMAPSVVAVMGLRKNGEEFSADATISKLEVGGRRVLTVALRDVTEQKRIEKVQRLFADVGAALSTTLDYEETAARVAEAIVQGFSDFCIVDLLDADGEVRRLSAVSRLGSGQWICDALRRVPAGQPQPSLIEWVLEWRQPSVIQRVTASDLEGLSYGSDHRRALKAIDVRSLMILPLVARGQLLGTLTLLSTTPFFIDVHADRRVAQEIAHLAALAVDNARLYREARRATQVRDEVLGIVAHDLRNPLSMVLMEARLLGDSGDTPERRSAVPGERIHRAAMRMSRLIQDLLDVTRLEAGRLPLDKAATPATQIANDAAELQRALAASTTLELHVELAADLPLILADRDRLLQVFENLIGNAIKFTPARGRITVGASPNGSYVCFWVTDTGPGISPEHQAHMFDRFWQARVARYGGAGLGLPIVKGIIEAHGGHLWVESAPGNGTTFFFTIPTVPALSPSPV